MARSLKEWLAKVTEDNINKAMDKLEDKEVFGTSKHIDIVASCKEALAAGLTSFDEVDISKANQDDDSISNDDVSALLPRWIKEEDERYKALIAKKDAINIDDNSSIRQDNEQAISKDIDVERRKREFLEATGIANKPEFQLRLRSEQLRTKPRVIYYQNGECQRTLI